MDVFSRVYIEISNICNLQCDFCPPLKRQKTVMAPDLFAKVASSLAGRTKEISLHLMGEPLGHAKLCEILEIADAFALPVNLTTNGVLLTQLKEDLCLHRIVRQVNVSVHSFEANHTEKDIKPYLNKVFSFTERALRERPDLYINYRVWDLTDPKALTTKNQILRDHIEKRFAFRIAELPVDIRRKKGYRLVGRLSLHFDSRFEWPCLTARFRSNQGTCHVLKGHIGVLADATVVPCCLDKEGVIPLGNLREQTLDAILAQPRARSMRLGFDQGELREALCQRCSFVSRFDRKLKRSGYGNGVANRHLATVPAALEK